MASNEEVVEEEQFVLTEWAEQQKKTFTAWCNSHTRKIGVKITVIEEDFRDGIKLLQLLEVISGETLEKAEKGKMRFHHIANVNKALTFIAGKGVKLVSIAAEEIVDGNLKMTLGMLWTIILRFAIQDIQIEDFSAKQGLLVWCQQQVKNHGLKVDNFHSSFKDGLVFCAIIHNNRPDLLKYHEMKKDDKLANLNLAFDVADKELDIPRMLDAEDMVNSIKNDERSVMTYVSSYYHKFAGKTKVSEASSKLANILKPLRENEHLIAKIEKLSSELLKWIREKMERFNIRDRLLEVSAAESVQQGLRKYFTQEKPVKLEDKALLETTHYNLLVRLGDKADQIEETTKMVTLTQEKWTELEGVEKIFEEWISNELQRLICLEQLCTKFSNRCSTHEAWANGKPQYLSSKDYLAASHADMRAMRKKMEAFRSELSGNDARVAFISKLRAEITELRYHDMASIDERFNKILETNKELKKLFDARESDLDRLLPIVDRIDTSHLEFAKVATNLKNWIDQALDDLRDTHMVASKTELAKIVEDGQTLEKEKSSNGEELAHLVNSCKQTMELIEQNQLSKDLSVNPYTNVTLEEVQKLWSSVDELAPRHQEWLKKEQQRMETNDKLLEQFNMKGAAFHTWVHKEQEAINDCSTSTKGTPQENRDNLGKIEENLRQNQSQLDELERSNHDLEDAYGLDTRSLTHSMSGLRVEWNKLFTSLQFTMAELENRIQLIESKGLTKEQFEELRECFSHFDKDKTQRLEPKEFKACLFSVGPKLGSDFQTVATKEGSTLPQLSDDKFARILKEVDPTEKGFVSFDAFINFMAKRIGNQNIEQQIVDSFKILAGDKEYVTADELRTYLSEEDVEHCLKNMEPYPTAGGDAGALDYKAFAKKMQAPESKSR